MNETILLSELLKAHSTHVSGTYLSELLGVSRVSIRSKIQAFLKQGYEIEGIRNKGYRLVKEPRCIHLPLLQAYLDAYKSPTSIFYKTSTTSTNDDAAKSLNEGEDTPFVIIAGSQSHGRGRMGRTWVSQSASNLYMSFAFRPRLVPTALSKITLWLGVCLCDMLSKAYDSELKIKWPNDLLYKNQKIAGILTESRIDTDTTKELIFGIGLNVCSLPAEFDKTLQNTSTNLEHVSGKTLSINQVAAKVIKLVISEANHYFRNPDPPSFSDMWTRHDALKGRTIKLQENKTSITGEASGLSNDGALLLRLKDGSIKAFQAGEVSLH